MTFKGYLKGYRNDVELCFSYLYGNGVYRNAEIYISDPLNSDDSNAGTSSILENVVTGEAFYIKLISWRKNLDLYSKKVLMPPNCDCISWPSDIIELREEQQLYTSIFAENEYTDNATAFANRTADGALLFSFKPMLHVENVAARLNEERVRNWHNPFIRRVAAEILLAMDKLNAGGYIYGDIHLSRFFWIDDKKIYLDFSPLAISKVDLMGEQFDDSNTLKRGMYPIEFAEPSVVLGKQTFVDIQMQNYCLCALLFYLLVGKYAYDGRLLSGYLDDSPQNHYRKFNDYHKMPIFIFDPIDNQNNLRAFDEDTNAIELWNELPINIKALFQTTLRRENAERIFAPNNPSPSVWLNSFREAGWI